MKSGRVVPSSVGAVKNGRRKMEDRHVVIHDMNVIFEDEHNPQVRMSAVHKWQMKVLC